MVDDVQTLTKRAFFVHGRLWFTVEKTLQIINQMQDAGVIGKYAIGGAVGASFYLEPTSSLDIDIFISFENMRGNPLAPLQPIYDYLTPLGAEPKGEHLFLKGWLVQFLPTENALNKEALEAAVETKVRGVRTWVMTAEHLMAIALKLGRTKDVARVESFIELGKYDQRVLDDILARHNLVEVWKKVSDNYFGGNK
jgi:hypothetical protein